jgi:hypothetical protein
LGRIWIISDGLDGGSLCQVLTSNTWYHRHDMHRQSRIAPLQYVSLSSQQSAQDPHVSIMGLIPALSPNLILTGLMTAGKIDLDHF